eukprot:CAMPEP_0116874046 /NCGR_PEP_ID=MMETSP0463-20121206/5440_1 /TAXON_ID=181622 /ORGANISM="Strombidinopsis sp, Strain SopsisLIS2011" /LENGTH=95 /DNA_ID=CAMNT_0004517163 /DNA_START=649 /DNA_END=936 /DNA_ORIENTATION=-
MENNQSVSLNQDDIDIPLLRVSMESLADLGASSSGGGGSSFLPKASENKNLTEDKFIPNLASTTKDNIQSQPSARLMLIPPSTTDRQEYAKILDK